MYKKVDKSFGEKIQENQLVKTICYPSVIMAHGLLVISFMLLRVVYLLFFILVDSDSSPSPNKQLLWEIGSLGFVCCV